MRRGLLATLCLCSCALFGGSNGGVLGPSTLDLSRWTITKMNVGAVGDPVALCPGERIQLSIVAELKHKERDKVRTAQTYQGTGPGLGGRGKLGFDSFAMQSQQGSFDAHGWFTPSPDPFVSVDGFTLDVEHTPNPEHAASLVYKPRYDCISVAGRAGTSGSAGSSGAPGGVGKQGKYGGSSDAGGPGGDGASGGAGGSGTAGAAGPTLTAWATVVRTPHHHTWCCSSTTATREAGSCSTRRAIWCSRHRAATVVVGAREARAAQGVAAGPGSPAVSGARVDRAVPGASAGLGVQAGMCSCSSTPAFPNWPR